MTRQRVQVINALSELERANWDFVAVGDNEVRCKCPVHQDSSPSCHLNVEKNKWICHACKAKGDIITLLAHIFEVKRETMLIELSKRYDLEEIKTISLQVVEEHHDRIREAGPLLKALRERGISDEAIRVARLGFFNGRIMIPVFDSEGRCVNIRRYLPGAPGPEKMKNLKGYSAPRLYQIDQVLKYDTIWICAGEMKALAVSSLLNEHGIGACAPTAGEGSWNNKWTGLFADKTIYLCPDIDSAGLAAAKKYALALRQHDVRLIHLPLDKEKYPTGDVNDYIGREGATAKDLMSLMKLAESPSFGPANIKNLGEKEVELTELAHPSNINYRLQFSGNIIAADKNPYLVPRKIQINCTRDQPNCHICPVSTLSCDESGFATLEVPTCSDSVITMLDVGKSSQRELMREALNIPKCKVVELEALEHYRITDVRLSPRLEITSEVRGNTVQPAFCIGDSVETNTPYAFEGYLFPHPRNQSAVVVIDKMAEMEDSLLNFAPSKEDLNALEIFRPDDWSVEAISSKLEELYEDIETNVTRIFCRRRLHLVFDLSYHCPLLFNLDGRLTNGWVNSLVAGDSAQGKSETAIRLSQHYGLGERVDCKNATVAGLLGGLQQLGTRWFVSWGVIPTHDRRIVILEEIKGASTEVIARLTDMRSSGIAEIPKIERRRTHARTRLVFISNPRSNRPIASYNFGIDAIRELIGNLEDVRRFDIAIIVSADEIDPKDLRKGNDLALGETKYPGGLCRKLILWGWTRQADEVILEPDTYGSLSRQAEALSRMFTDDIPLIDRGTIRQKLARLSASLAVRTFSEDEGRVVVRPCHVDFIASMLRKIYSSNNFGYLEYSRVKVQSRKLIDPKKIESFVRKTKHPDDLVRVFLYRDSITLADIRDVCEVDRDGAEKLLSFFVRKHALRRGQRNAYIKNPEFIDLLRSLENQQLGDEEEDLAGAEF